MKIPEGLTVRVSSNARSNITTILAYRAGGFKRAYKATIPMCSHPSCATRGKRSSTAVRQYDACKVKQQKFTDALVKNLIKSYC